MGESSAAARQRWELENAVRNADDQLGAATGLGGVDAVQAARPWARDPHHFKQWVFRAVRACVCAGWPCVVMP
jgi:hypothetical protein